MDRSFEVFSGHYQNEYSKDAMRRRMDWLCEKANGIVLDVGCSQGLLPWLLGHRGVQVVGIDCDIDAIAWARENLQKADSTAIENITLLCEDFLCFSPKETFDTIVAGEYLEHLPDEMLDKHLAHMAELLSPHGHVLITVPLGLHPHPDHYQVFLPTNFVEKIGRYFSIRYFDVEDVCLRCICDLSRPFLKPSPEHLLTLAEKGILQLQTKVAAGKRAVKVKELQKRENIEAFLLQPQIQIKENPLRNKLASKGLFAPYIYDRYLFVTLNNIYQDTPLVPNPREITPQSLFMQADKRVGYLQKHLGSMEGMHCLEIGCGTGETAVRLAERAHCKVTGVDASSYLEWSKHQSSDVRFMNVDLTVADPFEEESFDRIVSFAVLEHVQRPLSMLESMFKLLKPGGLVYCTANLYRGPKASHRYREVFFPWPHLLFEDAVFRRFYRDLYGRDDMGLVWVNKLTHLHYLEKIQSLGFEVLRCTYSIKPFDLDFYECFIEKLGSYPKEDLEKDFINVLLRKPEG